MGWITDIFCGGCGIVGIALLWIAMDLSGWKLFCLVTGTVLILVWRDWMILKPEEGGCGKNAKKSKSII